MPSDDLEALAENLGANLRRARQQRGLTQQQLASLSKVPRSTLANLEAGGANPTLAVMAALSAALGQSLEELLAAPAARCQLYPRGALPIRERARGTVTVHKLLPHAIPAMEIDRVQLAPGARMVGVPHQPGTQEYLTCERGKLVLTVEGERFDLGPGDVAAFPGDQAHGYRNPGSSAAVGFSVVVLAPRAPRG